MGITIDIERALEAIERTKENLNAKMVDFLIGVGERFVEVARETKTYTDRTGNLTSSIGYGIFENGTPIRIGGFLGGDGEAEGLTAIDNASVEVGEGLALVVVAGMQYATYVERSGFSVLDGARVMIDQIVDELKSNIEL